ncbi:MAG: hypothetical protein ACLQD8_05240 [Thermoplasmata archaeon]
MPAPVAARLKAEARSVGIPLGVLVARRLMALPVAPPRPAAIPVVVVCSVCGGRFGLTPEGAAQFIAERTRIWHPGCAPPPPAPAPPKRGWFGRG